MCPHLNKELNKSLNGGEGQLFLIEKFKLINMEGTRETQKAPFGTDHGKNCRRQDSLMNAETSGGHGEEKQDSSNS